MAMTQLKAVCLGIGFSTLIAGCSGSTAGTPPALPFGSGSAQHGTTGSGPHFLHQYKLPTGTYPSSIIAGPDGAMWFGTYPLFGYYNPTHLGIWRITTKGRKHFWPFENGVYDIAAGGDGRIWFTNPYQYTYNIGAITTDGKITAYSQASNGSPESIAADASGHLWYTSFGGTSFDIVEVDTSGNTVGTFKAKDGFADKVAYGPKSAIWFNAIANPVVVGRITRKGGQVDAPIGGPNYIPGRMVLGPDGRMWICDGDALAAVDTQFNVTLYALTAGGSFAGVTVGPDGNLWGAESQYGHIVRVTTSGTITEYKTPGYNWLPTAIAAGPDGNLWFPEFQRHTGKSKLGTFAPQ